jgi:hypothetical protein
MPEPQRVVISNATPIISLALIGKLDLLQQLYTNIMIPPDVQAEVQAGGIEEHSVLYFRRLVTYYSSYCGDSRLRG